MMSISEEFTPHSCNRDRCDFYQHITLPPGYVPRPELLAEVRAKLLTGNNDLALISTIKLAALRGIGGIGKSVMARALCEDSEVQAAFPDGILWTTLGQTISEDELKTRLREWINVLGGTISETAPTLAQLKNTLPDQPSSTPSPP